MIENHVAQETNKVEPSSDQELVRKQELTYQGKIKAEQPSDQEIEKLGNTEDRVTGDLEWFGEGRRQNWIGYWTHPVDHGWAWMIMLGG